jgi:peptidoglycan/xylan/chitin deacetylase (PgdA/CDA1 family)
MYHELETPRRAVTNRDPEARRYVVSVDDFAQQMAWLKSTGLRAMDVSQGIHFPHPPGVVVTFDDGNESDLIGAIPVLQAAGFSATFYVTVAFLGRRGYLCHTQLRELSGLGFEIGCHSMTHSYLNHLIGERLDDEVAGAKIILEQILGKRVEHFSCPGGRWTPQVARAAKQAGFASVTTSRARANSEFADPFHLDRVAIMRHTTLEQFQSICSARGLWRMQLRDLVYVGARHLLGDSGYERIW